MSLSYSINQRTLLATTLVLVCFLGFVGWVLDLAFRDSAAQSTQQRLETTLYGLLAVAEVTELQQLSLPNFLTDERFNRPDSGLYALITDSDHNITWQSRSLLGKDINSLRSLPTGQRAFLKANEQQPYFIYSAGIAWEVSKQQTINYTFNILSSPDSYQAQVRQFRQSLWGWLVTVAFMLTTIQIILLRWSLSPLRRVSKDLLEVESGKRDQLSGSYPIELHGLTRNLNHLLKTREQQLVRSRNSLADLAHSLKTPLAVLRGIKINGNEQQTIQEQTGRMTRIVDYQLQRAATAGHTGLITGIKLKPAIQRLANSLDKVHAEKHISCELEIPQQLEAIMEEDDLMELAGNLLDNAYKWANSLVRVSAYRQGDHTVITIEDDGPGIDTELHDRVMQRGTRADLAVDGQGIGLAVCQDIVNAYQGNIEIKQSQLNGASVTVTLTD